MKVEQRQWSKKLGWKTVLNAKLKNDAALVLVFGAVTEISDRKRYEEVRAMYPKAHIVMGSTAGEILGTKFSEESIALTAVGFDDTPLAFSVGDIKDGSQSEAVGARLGKGLPPKDLVHAMVFSDGLRVNGTALVKGMLSSLPKNVSVTGGLVGGGNEFKHTYVGLDSAPVEGKIVLVGFYGSSIRVGYGSLGGWDPFGPERQITKSKGNVLYELDGKPALKLYKEYLGDKASELPASGLLFPLNLRVRKDDDDDDDDDVVRTLLSVDEKEQSMTFAGDMPEGVYAKLMKANFDRLVDGAGGAAKMSIQNLGGKKAKLAVLVSCIGRKLVLKGRVEEELEAVQTILGNQAKLVGFYSYGEICPTAATERQCQLHNQTMTVTVFDEV